MNTSETIERLAAAIAEEAYIDIAKWHLYLNDARLHLPLAERLLPMVQAGTADEAAIAKVLAEFPVPLGGGKRTLPLSELIPAAAQLRLVEAIARFHDEYF